MLGNLFGNEVFTREQASFVPAVNISEEPTAYKLELSAPGYKKTDLKSA
ncbi:MAG: hypothetical protein H7282_00560 [Cytophagaceae bacterium]|nr:hypothetical protein [Cytophagaceae bacterium]